MLVGYVCLVCRFLTEEYELQQDVYSRWAVDSELQVYEHVALSLQELVPAPVPQVYPLVCFTDLTQVQVAVLEHLDLDTETGRRNQAVLVLVLLDYFKDHHRVVHFERFQESVVANFKFHFEPI